MNFTENLKGPLEFYNGTERLWFNEDEWTYYRETPSGLVEVGGVTKPIHIIDKSDALTPWASKMCAEKALRLYTAWHDGLEPGRRPMHPEEFSTLMGEAKSAHRDKLEDAGLVGHAAHAIIEEAIQIAIEESDGRVFGYATPTPKDERVLNCVDAAIAWMKKHEVKWLETERKIFSRAYNYAGTMDGLCLVDGKLSVADWKTSNYLYPEYAYQTAAYAQGYYEEMGELVVDRWIMRLGKVDGKFESWHITGLQAWRRDFDVFSLCQQLHIEHNAGVERMKEYKRAQRAILKAQKVKS